MKSLRIAFGALAILLYVFAFSIVYSHPIQDVITNDRFFFLALFLALLFTLFFLMIDRVITVIYEEHRTKPKQIAGKKRPEISTIHVGYYGDEKVMIDNDKITNLEG